MEINQITHSIIGAALKVHTELGPGLLESTYQECLYYELKQTGLLVQKEKPIPLIYKSVKLEVGYRCDLVIQNLVLVELKSIEAINDIHIAQMLTYLKLAKFKVGLLINFNVLHLKDGIRRLIL
ncbi:MAG TPA: GxxExxY protein [Bacteroidia bacterium]|nr:GxxExxY protein [Bacteroidia bacterium]